MIRKNQLKKLNLQKLEQFSNSNTDGQALSMVHEIMQERNQILHCSKANLQNELDLVRKQTRKTLKQMNDGVKDRLAKKQRIIMDKNSRPSKQKQAELIDRNYRDIDNLLQNKQLKLDQWRQAQPIDTEKQVSLLDEEYAKLTQQCSKEQLEKDRTQEDLLKMKAHVGNIHQSIEKYRIKYEQVESCIRQRERELDQLTTYFKNRTSEDQQNVNREKRLGQMLQNQLLKAQSIFNFNSQTNNDMQIQQIELN